MTLLTHVLEIETNKQTIVTIHIDKEVSGYRIMGCYNNANPKKEPIDIPYTKEFTQESDVLLADTLNKLSSYLTSKSESITKVHNPYGDLIVPTKKQESILLDLGVNAPVSVA